MTEKHDNIIIFGATGAVGSSAAQEAHKRGAHVWLAVRDTNKPIPGLTSEQEKAGKYTRIQADLSDPYTVQEAVTRSGAKSAFVYRVQTSDNMRTALEAMKAGGITYIAFLSSFTIEPDKDMKEIPQSRFIPYIHAQIEMTLEDLGIPHLALRPGDFASNGLGFQVDRSVSPPEAYVVNGDRLTDKIVPSDIGRLAGALLVDRPTSFGNKKILYVYGPNLMTYDEMWATTNRVMGMDIKVLHPDKEGYIENMSKKMGSPRAIAESHYDLQQYFAKNTPFTGDHHKLAVEGYKRYTGYEMTTFEEYLEGAKKGSGGS